LTSEQENTVAICAPDALCSSDLSAITVTTLLSEGDINWTSDQRSQFFKLMSVSMSTESPSLNYHIMPFIIEYVSRSCSALAHLFDYVCTSICFRNHCCVFVYEAQHQRLIMMDTRNRILQLRYIGKNQAFGACLVETTNTYIRYAYFTCMTTAIMHSFILYFILHLNQRNRVIIRVQTKQLCRCSCTYGTVGSRLHLRLVEHRSYFE
jgi:hypothetical protein